MDNKLEAIRYCDKEYSLELLDQRRLPTETIYLPVQNTKDAWQHIKDMVVRGAPAIGVTAALSMAVELKHPPTPFNSSEDVVKYTQAALDYLVTSRPTAVNLADACTKLKNVVSGASGSAADVVNAVVKAAEDYYKEDTAINKAIGDFGAASLLKAVGNIPKGGLRVMTICNTGSLATAGYGTALGVIRSLHSQGKLGHVFACETRPYNQGSRLTAYELVYESIPGTLICDSMAAYKMQLGEVDAVVVGADRVAANGDTANKVGTYSLAVSAAHHGIPFFVAAPRTSIDLNIPNGDHIVIEQRDPKEITHSFEKQVAASGINVWNPAFDVTPGALLTGGLITEKGVLEGGAGNLDVAAFLGEQNGAVPGLQGPPGFKALDEDTVKEYLHGMDGDEVPVVEMLGGSPESWTAKEVGDGNINFVYIVHSPSTGKSMVVKQALPYVRCVGESWPLTQDRARLEGEALIKQWSQCPDHVPKVWKYDDKMKTIIMQYIEPPHIILRKGLCQGIIYPHLAEHMSTFMAATLFNTSRLAMSDSDFRLAASQGVNKEMCAITELVIFTEPYGVADNNRHTTPQLDDVVASLRADLDARMAISKLKHKFTEQAEAFIHGDLHTGSLMATPTSTLVIDPEFAFYGPMGFDVGSYLANLVMAFFAQPGHATDANPRIENQQWLLACVEETWEMFAKKFLELWNSAAQTGAANNAAYPALLFGAQAQDGANALELAQKKYMANLFQETVGFMGCEVIRRIVGIAHNEDFESIQNQDHKGACESKAMKFARKAMVVGFVNIKELINELTC